MKKIILLNKKEGETPLESLVVFRNRNPEYQKVKMTYAGRLDPMASGLLLILTGEKTKEKEKYLNLDKEYSFQILFGFSTDTHDILGKVTKTGKAKMEEGELLKKIKINLEKLRGEFLQQYPLYSSKTVKGRPLFLYAREEREVVAPKRKIRVKKLNLLKIKKIGKKKLYHDIGRRINKVKGDFRQDEILKTWNQYFRIAKAKQYFIAELKIKCSSGTYVRSIADSLGQAIGVPALAYAIKRTRIGKWSKI